MIVEVDEIAEIEAVIVEEITVEVTVVDMRMNVHLRCLFVI
jgi:hypothetical protein